MSTDCRGNRRPRGRLRERPDDPGGATNHGVTIHTLRRLGIDVNRDTRIDVADVRP
jgi:lysozyme family protein